MPIGIGHVFETRQLWAVHLACNIALYLIKASFYGMGFDEFVDDGVLDLWLLLLFHISHSC